MARENDTRCAKKKKGKKNEQLETIRNLGMIRSDDTRRILASCIASYIYIYVEEELSFVLLLITLNLSVLTSEKLHDYIVADEI